MQESFLGNSAEDLSKVEITIEWAKMILSRQNEHEHSTKAKWYSLKSSLTQQCVMSHLKLPWFCRLEGSECDTILKKKILWQLRKPTSVSLKIAGPIM